MSSQILEDNAHTHQKVGPTRHLTWLNAQTRPLATRVDMPADGYAVGAVIIAPSFGREAVVSLRTTKALAAEAARAGFIAYTFTWTGDQDSSPLAPHDDPFVIWRQDLQSVVAHARSLIGDDHPVNLVGIRLGAAVVACSPDTGLGERVMWEPVTGKAFLRHHRLIRQTSVPVTPVEHGIELDGTYLSEQHARGIARLELRTASSPTPLRIRKEKDRATGLRLALGAPYFAHVPLDSLCELVANLPTRRRTKVAPWSPVRSALVHTAHGPVKETWCEIGPYRLPGILTESCDQVYTPEDVGVLFTAMGAEHRAGPGDIWTALARDLAITGVPSLRADRREIGDASDPDRSPEPRPYTASAVADVTAAAQHLGVNGRRVIGVGVCAGAWALAQARGLSYLVGVNIVHWNPDAEVYNEAFYRRFHGSDPLVSTASTPSADDTDQDGTGLPPPSGSWATRTTRLLRQEAAIRLPHLRSLIRPDVPLDDVSLLMGRPSADLPTLLVFGPHEYRIFVGKRGRLALRRASRRGADVQVRVHEDIDHSLLSARGQERVAGLIRDVAVTLAGAPRRRDGQSPCHPFNPGPEAAIA